MHHNNKKYVIPPGIWTYWKNSWKSINDTLKFIYKDCPGQNLYISSTPRQSDEILNSHSGVNCLSVVSNICCCPIKTKIVQNSSVEVVISGRANAGLNIPQGFVVENGWEN